MTEEIKDSETRLIYHKNIVDISRETYERNCIETIAYDDGILWLTEKHIEGGLDHRKLPEITIKYHSDHRKNTYGLDNKSRKQCNTIFIDEN